MKNYSNRSRLWKTLSIILMLSILFSSINLSMPNFAKASASIPTLTTENINPTSSTVTFAGMITLDGGDVSTYWGFKYGSDSRPDLNGSKVGTEFWGNLSKSTRFTASINLAPGNYYYCSFAKNSGGVGYGPIQQFTVPQPLSSPVITEPYSDGADISLEVQGGINVKWNTVSGAERYIVAVRDSNNNLMPGSNDQIHDTQYTISYIGTDLTAGYSYTIEVSAVRGGELKTSKRRIDIIPPTPTIKAPNTGTVDLNNIDISWDKEYVGSSQNATYKISFKDLTLDQAVSGYTSKELSTTAYTFPSTAAILNHKYRVDLVVVNNGVSGGVASREFTVISSNDTVKPSVVKTTPLNGAICPISLGTLSIEYSEEILTGPNVSSITVAQAGLNSLGVASNVQGRVLTLTIDNGSAAPFQAGKTYTVKLPVGTVKDLAGNSCDAYQFTFSIDASGDGSAPYVLKTNPVNVEQSVSPNQEIIITFNEAVIKQCDRPVIINNATYGDATLKTSQVLDSTGKILTITRTDGLDWGGGLVYTCTIPFLNIKDMVGNEMAQDFSFSFTIDKNPTILPSVTISSPSSEWTEVISGQKVQINAGGTNCTAMAIRIDGVKKSPDASTATSISYSWNTTGETIGSHTITVNAYNSTTNKNVIKDITVKVIAISIPGPTININNPLLKWTEVMQGQKVQISATGTNCTAMAIRIDGVKITPDTSTATSISYSWNTTGISMGEHIIRINAYNSASNNEVADYRTVKVSQLNFSMNSVAYKPNPYNKGTQVTIIPIVPAIAGTMNDYDYMFYIDEDRQNKTKNGLTWDISSYTEIGDHTVTLVAQHKVSHKELVSSPKIIKISYGPVQKIDSYSQSYVYYLRSLLIKMNYLSSNESNGKFDKYLKNTVKEFQAANNLDPDGKVGDKTWGMLLNDDTVGYAAKDPTVERPLVNMDCYNRAAIKYIQKFLLTLGYLSSKDQVNGVFDSVTEEKVKEFQSDHEYVMSGEIDTVMWEIIINFPVPTGAIKVYFESSLPESFNVNPISTGYESMQITGVVKNDSSTATLKDVKMYLNLPSDIFLIKNSSYEQSLIVNLGDMAPSTSRTLHWLLNTNISSDPKYRAIVLQASDNAESTKPTVKALLVPAITVGGTLYHLSTAPTNPGSGTPPIILSNECFIVDSLDAKRSTDGSYQVSMNIFNPGPTDNWTRQAFSDGVFEIFDSKGNLTYLQAIPGYKPPQADGMLGGFVTSVGTLWDAATDKYSILKMDLRDAGVTKKTEISGVTLPAGGKIVITKADNYAFCASCLYIALDSLGLGGTFNKPEFSHDRMIFLDSFIKSFLQQTGVTAGGKILQASNFTASDLISITAKATEAAIKDVLVTHPEYFSGLIVSKLKIEKIIEDSIDVTKCPQLLAIHLTEKIVLADILRNKIEDMGEHYLDEKNSIKMIE